MPKLDKTGPTGAGPRTGRGMGQCGAGIGYRRGRGFGRFCGCSPYPLKITEKEEKKVLDEEVDILEEEIKAVKERIEELKG